MYSNNGAKATETIQKIFKSKQERSRNFATTHEYKNFSQSKAHK